MAFNGRLQILSVIYLVLLGIVQSEKFTSLKELEGVLVAEHGIAHDLRDYIKNEESRIQRLKVLADDFETHSADALLNPEHHLGNPVNAFLLVKRFTTDWEYIVEDLIKSNITEVFIEKVNTKAEYFPNQEDLSGAVAALLRLQDTYHLPTSKIAMGDLQGVKKSPALSAQDCFELGRMSYNNGDHYHSMLWMQEALERDNKENPKTANRAQLLDYFSFSAYMQGNPRYALNLTIDWLQIEPDHIRAQNNKKYYEQMITEQAYEKRRKGDEGGVTDAEPLKNEKPTDDYRASTEFQVYEALCRGEDTHPNPLKHKLSCQYKRHHPIYMIRPLREEIVNFDPFIAVYHDLITDSEIAKIKELASPRLKRATVQNSKTGELETASYRTSKSWQGLVCSHSLTEIKTANETTELVKVEAISGLSPSILTCGKRWAQCTAIQNESKLRRSIVYHNSENGVWSTQDYRTSKNAWLKDEEDPLISRVSTKSSKLASLTLDTVEELQVVNYGIGGHYEPHYDFARMTDVEAGGMTVFPEIGVKLYPRKGSCALWYNLMKSGEGDYRTRHAACPILTGQKWICNKWFHERGQEFIRPCSTDPNL